MQAPGRQLSLKGQRMARTVAAPGFAMRKRIGDVAFPGFAPGARTASAWPFELTIRMGTGTRTCGLEIRYRLTFLPCELKLARKGGGRQRGDDKKGFSPVPEGIAVQQNR